MRANPLATAGFALSCLAGLRKQAEATVTPVGKEILVPPALLHPIYRQYLKGYSAAGHQPRQQTPSQMGLLLSLRGTNTFLPPRPVPKLNICLGQTREATVFARTLFSPPSPCE